MYIKLNNGLIEKYPYSISDLKQDNNQTSFPSEMPDSLLAEFAVFKIEIAKFPTVGFDKNVVEGQPELVDGVWKQIWTVSDATAEEHLARVLNARANEYPSMSDYLDGIVKQDQAQINKYIADCLAVKAKYPKPTEV
jgi:hypothetical protein